jgi:hypothetical protein
MNLDLARRDIHELRKRLEMDAENIRGLARIAEMHEPPPTDLEDRI